MPLTKQEINNLACYYSTEYDIEDGYDNKGEDKIPCSVTWFSSPLFSHIRLANHLSSCACFLTDKAI